MKHRSVVAVLLLTIVTLGIYQLVWMVMTKIEMNKLGAKIPTAWLIIVPFVNIWWLWKYSEGVEQVTGNKIGTILAFLLLWLIPLLDILILQAEFNKVSNTQVPTSTEAFAPVAPVAPVAPEVTNVAPEAVTPPVAVNPVETNPTPLVVPTTPVSEVPAAPVVPTAPETPQTPPTAPTPPTQPVQ